MAPISDRFGATLDEAPIPLSERETDKPDTPDKQTAGRAGSPVVVQEAPLSRHSFPPAPVARTAEVKLTLTPAEKRELIAFADRSGRSVAEVIRTRLPIPSNPLHDAQPLEVVVTRDDA